MALDGTKHTMPQFGGKKGSPGSLPSGPHENDIGSVAKGSGKAGQLGGGGGVGVRSHKTRQAQKG